MLSIVAVVGVMGAFNAPMASAQTVGDVRAQIQQLSARIAELRAQLNLLIAGMSSSNTGEGTSSGDESSDAQIRSAFQPDNKPLPRVCNLLRRSLSHGASGEDVSGLQEFLRDEGQFTANVTGYFGPITAKALAHWQESQGIENVGIAGPITRARIKAKCGLPDQGGIPGQRFSATPERGGAPLSVAFSTWVAGNRPVGDSYTIDFGDGASELAANCDAPFDKCLSPGQNKHTYTSDGTYVATLIHTQDFCGGNPQCLAPVKREIVGRIKIYVGSVTSCTTEYNPVCGRKILASCTTGNCNVDTTYSNRCSMEADSAKFLYQGQCRVDTGDPANDPQCKLWFDGCNTCSRNTPGGTAICTLRACILGYPEGQGPPKPYCREYFSDSSNKPPTISSFSGPTTLNVNQTGTWAIKASDPNNGSLRYQITWGDEAMVSPYGLVSAAPERAFTQTTTFTHAYSNAGTYTVTIQVFNDDYSNYKEGATAKTSSTVRVGAGVCPAVAAPSGTTCTTTDNIQGIWQLYTTDQGCQNWRCAASIPVACTAEYAPVCGRTPDSCFYTDPPPASCSGMGWREERTYSNRCAMNAAGATFLRGGSCMDMIPTGY